jgi:D-3-phosphoglycerate dehydrogenase
MPVLYFDIVSYPEAEKELHAKRVDKQQLFRESDFISINLPLVPQTRGLVNADLIKLMKPTAFLINVARGPIWNEKDVVRALAEKWIAGAGSDVFESEPTPANNPLFQFENFVGTPHMAAHTEESMMRSSLVAQDILAVLEGRKPRFPVPADFYPDAAKP